MSKKILLADDSVTIQKVVSITLAHEDFELIIVDNGTEAVSKAKEINPDVILLDVVMPDKDGYEVCQEIKASDSSSTTPIILLTGTFEPFDENRATEVGADDFIKKPFESHALINKIKEMVFKVGDKRPARVADTEIEEIDGLDELEGIDDLSGFDDFKTPRETRLSEPPVIAKSPDLSGGSIDLPEVSLESPLDSPEIPLEAPSDVLPAEAGPKDDIWSVDEVEDISGGEKSLGLEGTDDLWGDEGLATESEGTMPDTAVIEEPGISEDTIVLTDKTETTGPDLGDGGFELGSDISIGDLENSADDNMFDDISSGTEVNGDDLFPDEVHEESLDDVNLSEADAGGISDGGFDMETSPLDVPEAIELPGETPDGFAMDEFGVDAARQPSTPAGIELPGETPDGFAVDEFGVDAPAQAPTPTGTELPGGGIDGLPPSESLGRDSVELDWGDDSVGIPENEEVFVFEDDFGAGGGDVGPTTEAEISKDFKSAQSENTMGETDWDLGGEESTIDTFGGFADDASTIAMDAEVEPQAIGDISIGASEAGGDMAGRSEEISRIVKEKIIDEGIIPEAGKVGKSEKEVGAAVDTIAREIVQKVVWEVVPELAEELIKDEIRRLKGEKEG